MRVHQFLLPSKAFSNETEKEIAKRETGFDFRTRNEDSQTKGQKIQSTSTLEPIIFKKFHKFSSYYQDVEFNEGPLDSS
jgi:hypothetical protein